MFATTIQLAVKLHDAENADAMMLVVTEELDWSLVKKAAKNRTVVISSNLEEVLEQADALQLPHVRIATTDVPVLEQLTQALLEGVASDALAPSAQVVALYSGFRVGAMDTVSFIHLDEHLGKLTSHDLRRLETSVPLETLRVVMDLALEIGREGRESKAVGAMFVVGDTRKVTQLSTEAGFDPVKGYSRERRDLKDAHNRESIKEVAQLDGAFIVSPDGVIEKAARLVDATHDKGITISAGLGARHWAAAAITKSTNAVAIVVSESSGTVRLFQNGEVLLRVEPLNRRAMKWKDFEYEPPTSE